MKSKFTLFSFIFLLSFGSFFAQEGLQITEIMFDVPPDAPGDANGDGTRGSRSDEFVEIYNGGTASVDLTAYQIIEREGVAVFSFPVGTVLEPGKFAVVFGSVNSSGFGNHIPDGTLLFSKHVSESNVGFENGLGKSNFSNSSDRVMLVNPLLADTVAEVYWGGTDSNPITGLSSKAIYLGPPNTVLGDSISRGIGQSVTRRIGETLWGMHTTLAENPIDFFSPGKDAERNPVVILPEILITEIMFDVPPDAPGDANGDGVRGSRSDEFVEIYNNGPIDADLTGYQILDREGISLYQFPDGTMLEMGKYAVVFGAVGANGFNNLPNDVLFFAVHQSDENIGFDNGAGKSNFSQSGDAVVIVNTVQSDTTSEIYWGTASAVSSKALYLGTPNTISGDSISGSIDQSVTSKLDSDLWDIHTVVAKSGAALYSPGLDAPTPPAENTSDVIITEVLFDPPSDLVGDANGDGVRGSRSDEFVELYNRGTSTVNLSGFQIVDRDSVAVYTFPIGTTIDPNQYLVVFGAVGSNGFGTNLPSGAVYLAVQESDENVGFDSGPGKTNFSSSSDNCMLVDPINADTLFEVSWGSATPHSRVGIYLGFPNTISGEPLNGSIDQSVTSRIDSDLWDKHTVVTGDASSFFSPGAEPIKVNIEDELNIPTSFSITQNYPNPFNPSTTIAFSLPEASIITLKIFNILGQEVATLVNERLTAGNYSYNFDASNLTSGVYLYRITTANEMITKKMLLLK